MVQSLILIQTFIKVSFTTTTCPEHIPLVRLSIRKAIGFAQTSNELCITFQYFVQQLTVVNVVAALALVMSVSRSWRRVHQKLGSLDIFEVHIFIYTTFRFGLVNILKKRSLRDIELPVLIEEILSCS